MGRLAHVVALTMLVTVLAGSDALLAQTAEERIKDFVARGDLPGLAAYTQQVVDLARDYKSALTEQQDVLARIEGIQRESADRFRVDMELLKVAISEERLERQKLVDLMTSVGKRGWKQMVQSGAVGASVGATKGAAWGLAGAAIGLGIELIIR